jgi:transposase
MSGACSADLRGRVIDAVEAGASARGAAVRFGVGVATAIVWVRRWRMTGERTARRQGNPGGSRLDPHEGFLLGLIEGQRDITLAEMRARLLEERGVSAGIGTLWRFFALRGTTVKKRRAMPASRAGLTSARRARPGSRASPISIPSG